MSNWQQRVLARFAESDGDVTVGEALAAAVNTETEDNER